MSVPNMCIEIVRRVVSCFYVKIFLLISGYNKLYGDMYSI